LIVEYCFHKVTANGRTTHSGDDNVVGHSLITPTETEILGNVSGMPTLFRKSTQQV
jgi:hypothetical protein